MDTNFKAIRLSIASPEKILSWSHGEVLKAETINYRTQRAEKDGLFCEKIFGPTKDWECYCGKYRKFRYKGVICDRCGVEVTRASVRRERMGHIKLAVPVSHIWFLRTTPSRIGLLLDLPIQELERVIYFTAYIITKVDQKEKEKIVKKIDKEYEEKKKDINTKLNKILLKIQKKIKEDKKNNKKKIKGIKSLEKINLDQFLSKEEIERLKTEKEKLEKLERNYEIAKKELNSIKKRKVISEIEYNSLSLEYGNIFTAETGAEAIKKIVEEVDLKREVEDLESELRQTSNESKKILFKKIKLIKGFIKEKMKPEWMFITVLPVIPPDLRPMVQIDGGRFATSDLNDLYRRVINRNNRLKKLLEINAPEVICRNEKRMLQEAVDALIDNSIRKEKQVFQAAQKRELKSLADLLKKKQGRFRQNLLGKRVDYSGRSVIVVGSHLKLHQCGLPKEMALELYKPFVISQLIKREYAYNIRKANKLIETDDPRIWQILEEIISNSYVLLNRAPTLHRLGIQAFRPLLIEGKAIQIHPFVCAGYNADFDGDTMAVYLPLSEEAQAEAKKIMLSSQNLLRPGSGDLIITPSHDVVWGCFYLTQLEEDGSNAKMKFFSSEKEAMLAYFLKKVPLREKIKVFVLKEKALLETSIGRVIFNSILPEDFAFQNGEMDKKSILKLATAIFEKKGEKQTIEFLDKIKELGFSFVTQSGLSWGMNDLPSLSEKEKIIKKADRETEELFRKEREGVLSKEERLKKNEEIWARVTFLEVQELAHQALGKYNPIYGMVTSGSRGNWDQLIQMIGLKGQVASPTGKIIELPIKHNYKEGLDVLEYFISTHGGRKGMIDTALKTADAGYLTQRLVNVAQDVIIQEEDCKDKEGLEITKEESEEMQERLIDRILGRVVLEDIYHPKTKKLLVKKGQLIDKELYVKLEKVDLSKVRVRSSLTCKSLRGLCRACYGWDLGKNKLVELGTAVGIIAAQSIGEPGTQLTLRTFHIGGLAGRGDITQGLPRVEELFEVTSPKNPALIADIDGKISIEVKDGQKIVKIIGKKKKTKKGKEKEEIEKYVLPEKEELWIKNGDIVLRGEQLTEGSLDLRRLYEYKGKTVVQKYILKEVQLIYSSAGQKVSDKHIEIIIRQMFSKMFVENPGKTFLLPGEIVSKYQLEEENKKVAEKDKAEVKELFLGIKRSSLSTESFLSAASFQETNRVLVEAAVSGKTDRLVGLKENVIIGRLIPVGTGYRK